MIDLKKNEIFENQNTEFKNMMDMTYDAATGADKLKLIKELGGIRSSIATVKSGIEKLKLVKRVKEIRDLLGVKSEMEPQPEPHQVEEAKNTLADVNEVMPMLKQFIGNSQMTALLLAFAVKKASLSRIN